MTKELKVKQSEANELNKEDKIEVLEHKSNNLNEKRMESSQIGESNEALEFNSDIKTTVITNQPNDDNALLEQVKKKGYKRKIYKERICGLDNLGNS